MLFLSAGSCVIGGACARSACCLRGDGVPIVLKVRSASSSSGEEGVGESASSMTTSMSLSMLAAAPYVYRAMCNVVFRWFKRTA